MIDTAARTHVEEAETSFSHMDDDVIACVSHQLRTPLVSIKGFLEVILKDKVRDPTLQLEFLTRASEDVDRLMVLVNELLDASRWDHDRVELACEEMNVSALITGALRSLQQQAKDKRVSVNYHPPKHAVTVNADPYWFPQVLINVVDNAIKFSEPHHSIVVSGQECVNEVTVTIRDHGPGIPPQAIPRVFDKFFQAGGITKRAGGGSGLGLYIAKNIVRAHGGRLDVESTVGEGSMFSISLPTVSSAIPRHRLFS